MKKIKNRLINNLGKIFNLSPKKSENVPKVNFGDILSFFLNTKETREVFTHFYPRLPLGQFFFRQFFASILSRYLRMLWLNVFWSRTLKDTEIFHSALQISSSNDVNLLQKFSQTYNGLTDALISSYQCYLYFILIFKLQPILKCRKCNEAKSYYK